MQYSSRPLCILYGSQTGTAQEFAEQLERMAIRRRFYPITCCAMDQYNISQLPLETMIVFVCSTTGQGDFPDNMKKFWRFLSKKSLPSNSLENCYFSVFGLGDSSYTKFNFVAKRVYRRVLQLGGKEIFRRGDGDEQHPQGIDTEFNSWVQGFWSAVMQKFPLPEGVTPIAETVLLEPRYSLHFASETNPQFINQNGEFNLFTKPFDIQNHFESTVIQNNRMTPETHWQDVRHIVFDIEHSGLKYNPGDTLAVHPLNKPELIDEFLTLVGLQDQKQSKVILKFKAEHENFLQFKDRHLFEIGEQIYQLPLYYLIEHYLAIEGTPKRFFFDLLSNFVRPFQNVNISKEEFDALDRALDRLQYFGSVEGTVDMYRYSVKEKRSFIEVLQDFAAYLDLKQVFTYLLDLIPRIQPRYFSIASSQLMYPNQVHLCVAVVQFTTPFKKIRYGMCSSWLANLRIGNKASVWIKQGTFTTLTKLNSNPIIMVGPGTGVAPFISYLQQIYCLWKDNNCQESIGKIVLIFGNRNREKDFLFGEFLTELSTKAPWFHLITCFSRDQSHKIYVQQRIEQEAQLLKPLIETENAQIFVAGNAKLMPKYVREAFVNISSPELIQQMDSKLKYIEETW